MSTVTKKITLENSVNNSDGYTIGILTSMAGYTLCWYINKLLKLNLKREKDLSIILVKQKTKISAPSLFDEMVIETNTENKNESLHVVYKYEDKSLFTNFYLIENKGTKALLMAENKQVSYFFTLENFPSEYIKEELLFQLNSIEAIEMAYEMAEYSLIDSLQLAV